MPDYIYRCHNGHETEIPENMIVPWRVVCLECGAAMLRKPQVIRVNWGGMPPSAGEIHPHIKEIINDAPRRRGEEVLQE